MSTKEVAQTEQPSKQQPPAITATSRGLQLTSLDDMWRFAQYVAASGLAPKGVETPQAILIALQMGAELGMPPMSSLQNVAVINGRPSVWGDAMLGVCRSSGVFDEEAFREDIVGDGEAMQAVCTVRRRGGQPITRTFSVDDAKKANLWGKTGPWQQYPQRMLQCRARAFALRDGFSDILRGFILAEEARDLPREAIAASHEAVEPAKTPLQQLAETIAPKPSEPEFTMMSDDEKLKIQVSEALEACETIVATAKVMEVYQDRFAGESREWLVDQCDKRAQQVRGSRKQKTIA